MRIKSILMYLAMGTLLSSIPLHAQNNTGVVSISDNAALELTRLAEKSKSVEATLDRTITESAVLFSIPPGLTILGIIVTAAVGLTVAGCGGVIWCCSQACD